jgi:hypothetical protein
MRQIGVSQTKALKLIEMRRDHLQIEMKTRNYMSRVSLLVLLSMALLAQTAQAAEPLEIGIILKDHNFEPKEPKVPANQAIIITVTNEDDTPEEFESTALKVEKIVAPKSSIKLRIKGLAPARYEFFGEYNESAKGALIVE